MTATRTARGARRAAGGQRLSAVLGAELFRMTRSRAPLITTGLAAAVYLGLGTGRILSQSSRGPAGAVTGLAAVGIDVFAVIAALAAAIGTARDLSSGAMAFRATLVPRRTRLLAATALGYAGQALAFALAAMVLLTGAALIVGGTMAPLWPASLAANLRGLGVVALMSGFGTGIALAARSPALATVILVTAYWLAPVALLVAGNETLAHTMPGMLAGQAVSAAPEPGARFGGWTALVLLAPWTAGALLVGCRRLKGRLPHA